MNQNPQIKGLIEELQRVFVDHQHIVELLVIGYLLKGHILIEGPPGTGKTSLAKALCHKLSKSFKRIQFTADLLPQDIIGSYIYQANDFKFYPGPVFSDVVLADEINRASPRAQSAMLEAMEERQVTVEGESRKLSDHFFVIATQNPQDHEGTFPLPEVQLDRFLMCLPMAHGSKEAELTILGRVVSGEYPIQFSSLAPSPLDLPEIKSRINSIKVDPSLQKYISDILSNLRKSRLIEYGPSIRAGIALLNTSRALAFMQNRDFVTPDDVKFLCPYVFSHRVRISPEAMVEEKTKLDCIKVVVHETAFPV